MYFVDFHRDGIAKKGEGAGHKFKGSDRLHRKLIVPECFLHQNRLFERTMNYPDHTIMS